MFVKDCFEQIAIDENLIYDKDTINLLHCFEFGDIDKQFISYLNIIDLEVLRYICNDLQVRPNNQHACRCISSIIDFYHKNLFPELSLHSYDKTCYHRESLFRKAFMFNTPTNEYFYRLIRVYLVLSKLKTPENKEHLNCMINYCYYLAIIWRDISHPYKGNKHLPKYTRTYTQSFKDVSV